MKLSQDLEIALNVALSEAERLGHEYAGAEHLLFALTFDPETNEVLGHAGADVAGLRRTLATYLQEELERLEDEDRDPPRLTLALQRALGLAAARAESTGRE